MTCNLASVHDTADLIQKVTQAGPDYTIGSHVDADPGFIRRLLTWNAAEPVTPCLEAYRRLNERHPELFAQNAVALACLDRSRPPRFTYDFRFTAKYKTPPAPRGSPARLAQRVRGRRMVGQ